MGVRRCQDMMNFTLLAAATLLLFLALPASASGDDHDEHEHATPMYSKGWRAWFGYTIPAAGEYHIKIRGRSCKNTYLGLVALNAESTMDEHLEETASKYFNHTYPFNIASTYGGCTFKSWGDTGTCSRIIVQQNSSMEEAKTKYDAVALTSNEAAISTVPFFQLQFNSTAAEECTNTAPGAAVDAHAGHNHRRSEDHGHSASGALSMVLEFPTTKSDGSAMTYPANWYFFSDQNLTYWEFDMERESDGSEVDLLAKEILADPNACVAATAAAAATTVCDDSDGDKYMWSGIIFGVGLLGTIPLFFKFISESPTILQILSIVNCFGGGALLAVAVAHVFPEALDMYPASKSGDYPAAAMLCAAGYWLLLMIDKVLVSFCANDQDSCNSTLCADECNTIVVTPRKLEKNAQPGEEISDGAPIMGADNIMIRPDLEADSASIPGTPQPADGDSASGSGAGHGLGLEKAAEGEAGKQENPSHMLQAVGVFVAMAVHSLMAGFSLGLKCEKDSMENLAIAIVAHKIFDVSALGIVLARAGVPLIKSLPLALVVALMTPMGIWCGIAGDDVDHGVNGAMQAVCSGMFLYVAIQEVLSHEFQKRDSSMMVLAKSIGVLFGIGMIGLASIAHTRGGHTH